MNEIEKKLWEKNFKEQINTNLFRNIKKPIYFFDFESLVTDSIYIFKSSNSLLFEEFFKYNSLKDENIYSIYDLISETKNRINFVLKEYFDSLFSEQILKKIKESINEFNEKTIDFVTYFNSETFESKFVLWQFLKAIGNYNSYFTEKEDQNFYHYFNDINSIFKKTSLNYKYFPMFSLIMCYIRSSSLFADLKRFINSDPDSVFLALFDDDNKISFLSVFVKHFYSIYRKCVIDILNHLKNEVGGEKLETVFRDFGLFYDPISNIDFITVCTEEKYSLYEFPKIQQKFLKNILIILFHNNTATNIRDEFEKTIELRKQRNQEEIENNLHYSLINKILSDLKIDESFNIKTIIEIFNIKFYNKLTIPDQSYEMNGPMSKIIYFADNYGYLFINNPKFITLYNCILEYILEIINEDVKNLSKYKLIFNYFDLFYNSKYKLSNNANKIKKLKAYDDVNNFYKAVGIVKNIVKYVIDYWVNLISDEYIESRNAIMKLIFSIVNDSYDNLSLKEKGTE